MLLMEDSNDNEIFVVLAPNGNQIVAMGETAEKAWRNYQYEHGTGSIEEPFAIEEPLNKLLDCLEKGYSIKKVKVNFHELTSKGAKS